MISVADGVCVGCNRPMIRTHRKLLPGMVKRGTVRHVAQGLCTSCYSRRRKQRVPGTLLAQGHGWGSTKEPIDWVVVFRICYGEHLPSTPAERREATRILTLRRVPVLEIARRLGIADRTVGRYRSRLRDDAAALEHDLECVA